MSNNGFLSWCQELWKIILKKYKSSTVLIDKKVQNLLKIYNNLYIYDIYIVYILMNYIPFFY